MGVSVMEIEMPKENINCTDEPNLRAEVAWKPDGGEGAGHVQIATVHTASRAVILPEVEQLSSEVTVTINGEPASGSAVTTSTPGRSTTWQKLDGWHVTLDREQVNRLIRSLRRARDSAFGADA